MLVVPISAFSGFSTSQKHSSVLYSFSPKKPGKSSAFGTQLLQLFPVGLAGLHDIDFCRVDVGVAQEIGQFCKVFVFFVVGHGEEAAEVVGEDFGGLHACCGAEAL